MNSWFVYSVMTPCAVEGACGDGQMCLHQPQGVECICKYGLFGSTTKKCEGIAMVYCEIEYNACHL